MIVAQKSHTVTWGPRRVDEVFDPRRVRASFACLRSAENPERGISRGCVFTLQGLAKGGGGVLWLQDPKARRFLSNESIWPATAVGSRGGRKTFVQDLYLLFFLQDMPFIIE
ncbi:RNA-binding protein [Trypanosoma cruzi]|nr:RNA-binding protein [Trypanosoma cruzi]